MGGFIAGLGFDTTVMVRSILLRGFDRDLAERIGDHMDVHSGVKFAKGMVPSEFKADPANPERTEVYVEGKLFGSYDTVLLAIGRTGLAEKINAAEAGVVSAKEGIDSKQGKFVVDSSDKVLGCASGNIYAIGDVAKDVPELTPVAIDSGCKLVDRLFGNSTKLMDYKNVATAVFTPLEMGTVGLSEEDAVEKYGKDGIIVFHSLFTPLEWKTNHDRPQEGGCYAKVVCEAAPDESSQKVVGFHVVGPNAGEMIQGYAVALKTGSLTKEVINDTVGIHPTCTENLVDKMEIKEEGKSLDGPAGC